MSKKLGIALLIASASAASFTAMAGTPKNALGATAISADGTTLVAAGDNRVLYVLDPASLEVKQRVFIGVNPQEAFFSADGKTLVLSDESGNLHFLSTADWSEKAKVEDAQVIAVSAAADTVATLGYSQSEGDGYKVPFTVYALSDGSKKAESFIAGTAQMIAAAPDGSSYAVISERKEDAGEAKADTPADLQDLAKTEFEQKHDGYTAEMIMLDKTGKETGRTKMWYTTYDTLHGAVEGTTVYWLGYSNENIKVAADGTTTLFKVPPSYLYGMGISPDGKKAAAGSLRDGTIYNFADGSSVTYELDQQPGWPEYFEGFTFAPDGSIYGGTTAYRLAHIGADGSVIAVKPIF